MFTYVDTCLDLFTRVKLFTRVYLCLTMFTRVNLSFLLFTFFNNVYSGLPLFNVYLCLPMLLVLVYLLLPMFTRFLLC